jgi:hypothetical protein
MQLVLPGILKETRPEVAHFTNYLAPVLTDVPFVVSFHDMSLTLLPEAHTLKKRLLTASLIPTVARRARRILVPSESTRRDVARLLPVDPGRIRLVPYAASPIYRPRPRCAPSTGSPPTSPSAPCPREPRADAPAFVNGHGPA